MSESSLEWDAAAAQPRSTVVEVAIGGRRYPFISSPRCGVCQCEERFAIEEGLLIGRSYASIARSLPDKFRDPDSEHHISIEQMRLHVKNHMPADITVSRAIIERRAQEMGRSLDVMEGTLIDAYSVASEVMRLGFERIARGEIKVGLEHTLVATKMVNEMEEKASHSIDMTVQTEMVTLLLQHVRSVLSDEQWQALASNFRADPAFRAMTAQIKGEVAS